MFRYTLLDFCYYCFENNLLLVWTRFTIKNDCHPLITKGNMLPNLPNFHWLTFKEFLKLPGGVFATTPPYFVTVSHCFLPCLSWYILKVVTYFPS